MREKYRLSLQENKHPRDLVDELSNFYLITTSFNLALQVRLFERISEEGFPINGLINEFPDYVSESVKRLIEFLALYRLISLHDNRVYPTCYSEVISEFFEGYYHSPQEWNASYDILEYFTTHQTVIKKFSTHLIITIKNHSICYEAIEPDEIVNELFYGHLISRAVRFFTTSGMAEEIDSCKAVSVGQLLSFLNKEKNYAFSLDCLLKLLNRYLVIDYDYLQRVVRPGKYLPYLLERHGESIARAMYMITEPWWFACAYIEKSFLKVGPPAFEVVNKQSFYDCYVSTQSQLFTQGMASISLFEDQDVCDAIVDDLESFETIVDIGGGDGGLLKKIYDRFPNKRYVLFEKIPADCLDIALAEATLTGRLKDKYGDAFNPTIILGDFTKSLDESNLPRYANAAYLMKCVLHNIAERIPIIDILKNICDSLGVNSQFYLAERIVPPNLLRPHVNVLGNILMQVLFKAQARSVEFYKSVLQAAGFCPASNGLLANNYLVFQNHPQAFAENDNVPQFRF